MDEQSIFLEALTKSSPESQAAWLDEACGNEQALKQRLTKMLRKHARAKDFLEHPAPGLEETVAPDASPEDLAKAAAAEFPSAFGEDAEVVIGGANQSVLKSIGNTIDEVPRVSLRYSKAEGEDPIASLNSPEIPDTSNDHRYQLQGEIARGGMGAIIKGRDTDLGRDLAFKILLDSHKDKPDVIQRFVEEAQIGGQLQHPGIAPVYELGQFGDQRPYFSMKLVKGETLAKLLADRNDTGDDRSKFIGVFEQVCQTMAYAHSRGVIHRDLKPANIMVGAFGEVQVMDWGLAKVLQVGGVADEKKTQMQQGQSIIQTLRSGVGSDAPVVGSVGSAGSETQMGSVMGTPAYMPPEQALGEIDQLDERADVFALGAILCEILTGGPPYVAEDGTRVFRMASRGILEGAFSRLDDCGADDDLIALTKQCLELEPVDRPRDAGVLANKVTEYLESVESRLRETELQRAAEAARADAEAAQALAEREKAEAEAAHTREQNKRRQTSLALAASIFLLLALGSGGWLYLERQEAIRQTAEAEAQRLLAEERDDKRKAAIKARDTALLNQYVADIRNAQTELDAGNLEAAEKLLQPHEDFVYRGWEWDYLHLGTKPQDYENLGRYRPSETRDSETVLMVGISPDNKSILLCDGTRNISLWDLSTRSTVWSKKCKRIQHSGSVQYKRGLVAFGASFVGVDEQATVQVWDPERDKLIWESPGHDRFWFATVALAESKPWLAYYSDSGDLKVVNYETGRFIFKKDRSRLKDKKIADWDKEHGKSGPARMIAFSRDSKHLAVGIGANSFVEVWDVESGQKILEPTRLDEDPELPFKWHWNEAMKCHFSHDGQHLILGFLFDGLRTLDLQSKDFKSPFGMEAKSAEGLKISPNGKYYLTHGFSPDLQLWSTDNLLSPKRVLRGHQGEVWSAEFTSDGKAIVSVDAYGNILRWDLSKTLERRTEYTGQKNFSELQVATANDNGIAFLSTEEGRVLQLDLENGNVKNTEFYGVPLGLTKNLEELITVHSKADDENGSPTLYRWNLKDKTHTTAKLPKDADDRVTYYPAYDEVTTFSGNEAQVINASTGETLHTLACKGGETRAYFSDTANHFVKCTSQEIALYERRADRYELARKISIDLNTRYVYNIAVSPDKRWLALASLEHYFYLLDLTDPDSLLQQVGATNRGVRDVIFSPDSRNVLIAADDATIHVWNLATQRELLTPHPGMYVTKLKFAHSGKWLLAVGNTANPQKPNSIKWWRLKE